LRSSSFSSSAMSHFGSTSQFSTTAQFRSVKGDSASEVLPGFGETVYRSLDTMGAPFQKPTFGSKVEPGAFSGGEPDFALGIQQKGDAFGGIVGLFPRSAPSPDLPLIPAWISQHTSFVLRLAPAVAFAKILEILRSVSFGITVDVHPQLDKFQLKGKGMRDESMTYFKKKLYRNMNNEVVVECTRQDGCVVLFNKVYQKLLAALGNEARRLADTTLRTPPPLLSFPPPSLSSEKASFSSSLLRNLLNRACSQFLDEQFQACQALVSVSTVESAASWGELADVDVLAIVTLLLKSDSEDTAHLATLFLLNLLKFEPFRDASQAVVAALFALLDSPSTYKNQDTKRYVSTGLRVIAQTRKQGFSVSQRNVLEVYQKCADPVISGNALAILQV